MNFRMSLPIFAFIIMVILLQNIPSLSYEYQRSTGSRVTIDSRILGEKRTLSVALPDQYVNSQKSFPVLYVLDAEGQRVFPECVSTVSDLHTQGLIPQMIVIGIWNTDRNRDMIPAAVSHRPGSGGSLSFLNFIRDELMPYIGQNYRTADFSILYGMSNSALFTVYALLECPETFDAFIASSPMVGHCPDYIQEKAETFLTKDRLGNRVLYMIYGTEDSQRVTAHVPEFQKYLETRAPQGFESRLEILEGEGHVPDNSLERGLLYVFSKE